MSANLASPRDLNKNGRIDAYEDANRPLEERIDDLLAQMTLEEKAGLMFHTILPVGQDGQLVEGLTMFGPTSTAGFVTGQLINHFNVHALPSPRLAAEWHNRLQALAESTRLGIPVSISSDPRHAFSHNPGAGFSAGAMSQWPEPIGFGAIADEQVVAEFADIARQEYLALGIRVALHPMADLATEPRWGRINGTFGEDATLSARLVGAYVRGFQGETLGAHSVACMTKHFPGGGPQKDGEDPHFPYGREQVYPGDNFDGHLPPFEAAFAADTAQIMPYYGMPVGIGLEEVGFGFNKHVITDMLRGTYGFDGVVCTDWGLINDTRPGGRMMQARAWGVEHLTPLERLEKALDAGVDQFGGEACPERVIELVRSGRVSETRIDQSARRILRDKFRLGLFDNPYVDVDAAERIVGRADFRAAGDIAQRKSLVLLKNAGALPVVGRPRLYLENVSAELAGRYGDVVATPEAADLAIIRIATPYEPRNGNFLEQFFHAGDLDFKSPEKERLLALLARVPTIVDLYLERGAVIPEIAAAAAGLIANFGASDEALLDVVFGKFAPMGRLPFEMPSSMEAVRAQAPDLPGDSQSPLFRFGYGLTYSA